MTENGGGGGEVPAGVARDYSLDRLTTIRTGGPAAFFARPAAERELLELRDERSVTVGRLEDRVYWLDRSQVDLNLLLRRRPLRIAFQAFARLLRLRRGLRRR